MPVEEIATPEAFRRVLLGGEPSVVVFWAGWCGFCLAFRGAFESRASSHPLRFAIVRLDDLENPLWDAYDVEVVPTLAHFRGGVLVARKDGRLGRGISEQELDAFLEAISMPTV